MSKKMLQPFPHTTSTLSPWTLYYIPQYQKTKTAFVFAISHALSDGVSLLSFICNSCDNKPTYARRLVPVRSGLWDLLILLLLPALASYYYLYTYWTRDTNPLVRDVPLSGKRNAAMSRSYSLQELKRYSSAHHFNVTDLLLGAICLSAQDYVQEYHKKVLPKLKIGMPFNQRPVNDPMDLDNRYGYVMVDYPIPSDRESEAVRTFIYNVSRINREYKAGPFPIMCYYAAKMPDLVLPSYLSYKNSEVIGASATMIVASMGGPQQELLLNGKKTLDYFFMSSCVGKACVSVGIRSYCDDLKVLMYADSNRLENPKRFLEFFDQNLYLILGSLPRLFEFLCGLCKKLKP